MSVCHSHHLHPRSDHENADNVVDDHNGNDDHNSDDAADGDEGEGDEDNVVMVMIKVMTMKMTVMKLMMMVMMIMMQTQTATECHVSQCLPVSLPSNTAFVAGGSSGWSEGGDGCGLWGAFQR